jgi:deoxyhypusine synthase
MGLVTGGEDGGRGHTVSRLLARMRHSAFQGRKLGEAFEVWQRMIDGDGLISWAWPARWPAPAWPR